MSERDPFGNNENPHGSRKARGGTFSESRSRSPNTSIPPSSTYSWCGSATPPQTSTPISGKTKLRVSFGDNIDPDSQLTPGTDRAASDRHSRLSGCFSEMQDRFEKNLELSSSVASEFYRSSAGPSSSSSSSRYHNIGTLDTTDPTLDWPVTDSEREELKAVGIIFTGEERGQVIGEGAFGQIWRCEKMMADGKMKEFACKKVALKRYMIENKTLKRAQQLLINEMKAHQLAHHQNVVKTEYVHHIYDRQSKYPHPITTLIFMEMCDGDLADLMRYRRSMTEPIAARWFHQIAKALHYLHGISIAHRDIKLANILYKIGPEGGYCFKLTDFGLVQIFETKGSTSGSFLSKTYIGTEDYMAPEIEGKNPEDQYDPFVADVYSLGVCLLQTMKTMFKSLVGKFSKDEIQDTDRRVKGMSSELKDLLRKMLSHDPTYRLTMNAVCGHQWLAKYPYDPGFVELT